MGPTDALFSVANNDVNDASADQPPYASIPSANVEGIVCLQCTLINEHGRTDCDACGELLPSLPSPKHATSKPDNKELGLTRRRNVKHIIKRKVSTKAIQKIGRQAKPMFDPNKKLQTNKRQMPMQHEARSEVSSPSQNVASKQNGATQSKPECGQFGHMLPAAARRTKVRAKFVESFSNKDDENLLPPAAAAAAELAATRVEAKMYETCEAAVAAAEGKPDGAKLAEEAERCYFARFRDLRYNLKLNERLKSAVLTGEVSPDYLATAATDDLASDERQKQNAMLDARFMQQLTSSGAELANWSDGQGFYVCKDCGCDRTIFTAGSTSDAMQGRSNEVWGGKKCSLLVLTNRCSGSRIVVTRPDEFLC
eukprot:SAG31_NODE_42_length_31262_cov_46.416231_2_plen_368_part_00